MKFVFHKCLPVICVCLGLSVPQFAVAGDNAVMVGAHVHPLGSMASVSYERMVIPGFSVGARLSDVKYDYVDGSYNETGTGNGVEAVANYHFNRKGFSGPYVGVALGQIDMDWSWYNYYSAPRSGDGNTKVTSFVATFGWDFIMGSGNFVIRPSVILGSYSGTSTDSTGTKTSNAIGAVAGAGVAAVFVF